MGRDGDLVDTWSEVREVRDGIVSYSIHYAFAATGEEIVSPVSLRFRTEAELTESLAGAGFAVERVYGDWDRRPAGPTTPEYSRCQVKMPRAGWIGGGEGMTEVSVRVAPETGRPVQALVTAAARAGRGSDTAAWAGEIDAAKVPAIATKTESKRRK